MAQLNFGGVIENVMTREEFPLEKAREILKDEIEYRGISQRKLAAQMESDCWQSSSGQHLLF